MSQIINIKKFYNLLPKKYKLFYYTINNSLIDYDFVIYLSLKPDINQAIAYISGTILNSTKSLNISMIDVEEEFRGNGLGKFLMILTAEKAKELNLNIITLDDDSDMAWQINNMYVNLGIQYIGDPPGPQGAGDPEMEGEVLVIAKKWNNFRKKYKNRDFYKK